MTRKIEEFKPIKEGEVRIYSCGPTVYNVPHIGNWRSFVNYELLRRYLEYKGYKVTQVMNLTDVDDKTIRESQKLGMKLNDFTKKYIDAFFRERDLLNIEKFEVYPRATEHIKDMIALIKRLDKNGHTYISNGSVYYKISSFKDYGKLAHLDMKHLKINASGRLDNDEYEKENLNDFVLWKAWKPEDGDVFWETEYGKGRPGWHIECSAMSMKYLGETFDIHTGGVDLIFPHHTNEIAQSEGATGKTFVNYWFHINYLVVYGEKMSKSKGNFYLLEDIIKKGYDARTIRYLLISTHYRQLLNFTFEGLEASKNAIKRIDDFVFNMNEIKEDGEVRDEVREVINKKRKEFEDAMDNDLNIARALSVLFAFINEIYKMKVNKKEAKLVIEFLMKIDKVLGIMKFHLNEEVPDEVKKLVEKRKKARMNKEWKKADEIRDKIKDMGFEIMDNGNDTKIKRIR